MMSNCSPFPVTCIPMTCMWKPWHNMTMRFMHLISSSFICIVYQFQSLNQHLIFVITTGLASYEFILPLNVLLYRILKAFIWRDYETKPTKLKLLDEIRLDYFPINLSATYFDIAWPSKEALYSDHINRWQAMIILLFFRSHSPDVDGGNPNAVCESIDYRYVSAEHIPVINRICHQAFWPTIDCKYCV